MPIGLAGRWYSKKNTVDKPFIKRSNEWRRARSDTRGVDIHDPKKAYNGYTLYTSGDTTSAYLIDMQGHRLHQWHIDYSKLWQHNPDGRKALPNKQMYLRKAVMYPNGDLVAIIIADGDTPWGYGLVKLDANSHVIWKYHAAAHHDLQITPDGRIFTLTQAYAQKKAEDPMLTTPWLKDYLVELDGQTGKVLNKVSIFDALWKSRYRPLIGTSVKFAGFSHEDPLHTNSVQYLGPSLGKAFAPAQGNGDQVLLSMRYPGIAALLDLKSGRITWALKGSWLAQHSMRALPNGDRLVTESNGGRLFDLTPEGEIVWEFYNPVRRGKHGEYIPVVSSDQRIKPADLDPKFRRALKKSQD